MRWIGWIALILMGLCWLASEVPLRGTPSVEGLESPWRRTVDGWERKSWWNKQPAVPQPAFHPALVGGLQILLVVSALVAFSGNNYQRPSHAPKTQATVLPHTRRSPNQGPFRFLQMQQRPPIEKPTE